jgi:choline dehydrogenase-like flavoprotein
MLSGIGDPEDLKSRGIATSIALKGVGRNLQDHISIAVAYARKEPGPLHSMLRLDRIIRELGKAYFLCTGVAADSFGSVTAFLRSGRRFTDIQRRIRHSIKAGHLSVGCEGRRKDLLEFGTFSGGQR